MIEIVEVSKSFNEKHVLNNISLNVSKGTCHCLIGPNGSGKSTLLNILLGILKPDNGSIQFNRLSYGANTDQIRRLLGCIPEDSLLIEEMTGYEFLQFSGILFSIERNELKRRIKDLGQLLFTDANALNAPVYTYSTGMRRRLEFCAALIHSPDVLILDEPFSGLDPEVCYHLLHIMNGILLRGKTIFMSSHDLGYVREIATHITLITGGTIVFNDEKEKFFTMGESELTAFFKYIADKPDEQSTKQLPTWF